MAEIESVDNKVSLQDIDVEQYKKKAASTAAADGGQSLVEEGAGTIRLMGNDQHTITFKIDNSYTTFNLDPDSRTFADWGSFSGSPSRVLAKQVQDSVCNVSENRGFWTGAAGMIGYSISSNNQKVYLRFAATDPYWSARSNRTMAAIYTDNKGIDQGEYNAIYNWSGNAEINFDGKKLKVQSNVGSANTCTATFTIKWE